METIEKNKKNLFKVLMVLAIILSLYFIAKIISEVKLYSTLGNANMSTIMLSGHGEVNAVPDIANISFTISKTDKTVKDAQAGVAVIEKKALDFLKTKNIEDKDIKTENASFYPKYEYKQAVCPQNNIGFEGLSTAPIYYCPPGKQVIAGYISSESITVKVRNTDDVGAIMQGIGTTGVSNLNGPNFSIDDEDALQAEARKEAIDDAKNKAKALAKDLGVRLVRIVDFNDSGSPESMYYNKSMMTDSLSASPVPAQIPKGENTISSDVTITYEIR